MSHKDNERNYSFPMSEMLEFHYKTLLCSPQSQWLQVPNPCLPVKGFWQAGLGMVAWSSAGLGPKLSQDVLLCPVFWCEI